MHRVGTVRVNDDGGWQALAAPNKSLDASGAKLVSEPPADRGPQTGSPLGVVDAGG